jgi:uncharacterized protein involved in outer membrane biogenesis
LRKVLILGIGLLVLATGALFLAPRFVDPGWYRDAITVELRRITGREIAIAGPLVLTLLPNPGLIAEDVRLANPAGAAVPDMLRATRIDARLALMPLLTGKLVLRSLTLIDPILDLERLADGSTNWRFARQVPGEAGRKASSRKQDAAERAAPTIAIGQIAIANGTVLYRSGGVEERIDKLDLEASAQDVAGPAHAAGRLMARGARLDFELDIDRIAERMPLRLALALPAPGARVQLAGDALTTADGEVTFDGKATAAGGDFAALSAVFGQPLPSGLARPFTANADLVAGRSELRFDHLTFALDELHGTGALRIAPLAPTNLTLTLALNQVDIDRLATGHPAKPIITGSAVAKPPGAPVRDAASDAAPGLPASGFIAPSDLQGKIDLTVDALHWRGGIIRTARLQATLDRGALNVARLGGILPGGSDLSVNGTLDAPGGERQFRGAVELESNDLRLLLDWLGTSTAGIPADRLRKLTLSSRFAALADRIEIAGIDLTVDATRLTGAATVALRQRLAVGARLAVDQLNLDAYLPPPATAPAATNAVPAGAAPPVSAAHAHARAATLLAGFDANIDAAIDTLTWRGQPARGVRLAATLQDGGLTVREATIADFAGAAATASGAMTGIGGTAPSWHAAVSLKGPEIAHVIRLIAPGSALGSLIAGPFSARSDIAGERGGVALDLDLAAFGGHARVTGEVADSTPNAAGIDVGIEATHPSFAGLARAVAPGYQPAGGDPGPVKLSGKISETGGFLAAREMSLSIGGLAIEGDATFDRTGVRPKLTADIRFNELALDRLLPARQTASLDAPASAPPTIRLAQASAAPTAPAPPGAAAHRWSRETFDLAPLALLDADLSLAGDGLAWGKWRIERPVAVVALVDGVLRLDRLSGGVFGGTIDATGQIAAGGGQAKSGITVRHAALEQALQDAAGIGVLAGRADVDLALASSGRSAAELVARLQGSGRLASRDGAISGIDLPAVSARLNENNRAIDLPGLFRGLGGGATRYQTLDGNFRIADGVVQSDDLRLVADSGEARADMTIDLPKFLLRSRLELRLTGHPAAPPFAITLDGPLDAPRRIFDVNALESYLVHRRDPVKNPAH